MYIKCIQSVIRETLENKEVDFHNVDTKSNTVNVTRFICGNSRITGCIHMLSICMYCKHHICNASKMGTLHDPIHDY